MTPSLHQKNTCQWNWSTQLLWLLRHNFTVILDCEKKNRKCGQDANYLGIHFSLYYFESGYFFRLPSSTGATTGNGISMVVIGVVVTFLKEFMEWKMSSYKHLSFRLKLKISLILKEIRKWPTRLPIYPAIIPQILASVFWSNFPKYKFVQFVKSYIK